MYFLWYCHHEFSIKLTYFNNNNNHKRKKDFLMFIKLIRMFTILFLSYYIKRIENMRKKKKY